MISFFKAQLLWLILNYFVEIYIVSYTQRLLRFSCWRHKPMTAHRSLHCRLAYLYHIILLLLHCQIWFSFYIPHVILILFFIILRLLSLNILLLVKLVFILIWWWWRWLLPVSPLRSLVFFIFTRLLIDFLKSLIILIKRTLLCRMLKMLLVLSRSLWKI